MQRFLRSRQQIASSPEIPDSATLFTSPNGLIDDTIRVNDSIESSPLSELTESTPIPSATSTYITRKASSVVWQYAVTGHPIMLGDAKLWRCQICQDHRKKLDLKVSGGIDTIRNHLRRQHGIELQTTNEQ